MLHFADDIKALKSAWLIGDDFLHKNYDALQLLKTESTTRHKRPPYLYEIYNVSAWYQNPLSDVRPTVARLFNSLVEALNKKSHLPRYVIFIIDKDVLESIDTWGFGTW